MMRRCRARRFLTLPLILSLASASAALAQQPSPSETATPPVYQRAAPAGAPNIVLVLLDDVGFGAASTFGGLVNTPALDALARDGLRYNRFHTTAICSPTRASLLTGRNAHATGIGAVMNAADSRPGYNGFQTLETASIAEILRKNGYATGAFGKWHQVPDWEASQAGPFDRWPTGQGFDKFYGFLGGETDQFEPTLYDGTTPIMRPAGDHYHLTEDLADHAAKWMRNVRSVAPKKPFFLYFPTGGIHAPIQAPREWIDRYRGKFDQGWDKLREEIFARQKRLGVVPANAKLTPRPKEMPAWESLTPEQKRFSSRLMEAYAGFLAHTDAQVGKLVQSLKEMGEYDNTLFIYIVGDNGASGEGNLSGSLSYYGTLVGVPEPEAQKLARIDEAGGPAAYSHINAPWAWATNAPFPWTKTIASHLGGTRNPMVITWPAHIKDKGGLRSQFGHVNDIVPTILELTGIQMPTEVLGVRQKPLNGVSLAYSFDAPKAPERHTTQYFEVFGHRAIYHDGWMASAFHGRLPWALPTADRPMEQDKWELYDLRSDFSQSNDLSAKQPKKLKELQDIFMKEAAANQVLPLAGGYSKKALPAAMGGATEATYHEGAIGIPEPAIPQIANRSWTMAAALRSDGDARGVIAALGGHDAGMSLYLDADRRPAFTYRLFDLKTVKLVAPAAMDAGQHILTVKFDYDGGGFAKGGKLTLSVDGKDVAADTLPMSPLHLFSINENFGVGLDTGSPAGDYPKEAAPGYGMKGARIEWVKISAR